MDATMATLGPEDDTTQGLILPSKVMYRPQAGKSVLGMNLVLVRCLLMDPCCLWFAFSLINNVQAYELIAGYSSIVSIEFQ
jgi:hypothetical protein